MKFECNVGAYRVSKLQIMPKLYLGPGLSRRGHQALCRRLEQFMAANTEVTAPGKALVCNTESRRTELCDDIEKVVVEGCLTNKQAQRLPGRMQFAVSTFWTHRKEMFAHPIRLC